MLQEYNKYVAGSELGTDGIAKGDYSVEANPGVYGP